MHAFQFWLILLLNHGRYCVIHFVKELNLHLLMNTTQCQVVWTRARVLEANDLCLYIITHGWQWSFRYHDLKIINDVMHLTIHSMLHVYFELLDFEVYIFQLLVIIIEYIVTIRIIPSIPNWKVFDIDNPHVDYNSHKGITCTISTKLMLKPSEAQTLCTRASLSTASAFHHSVDLYKALS